jgi:two-component system, OmpR family, sensor kinase
VGLSLAPYEQAERTALYGSLALALTLLALVGVAVWWLLRSALRPVARMTREAAAWSEQDLDRRFNLGPAHDELTRLGETLDGLLDRLAASLRHERRFSAEMSHELRTPLAKLSAEAELTLRRDRTGDEYREALAAVLLNANQIERIVDALVAAARREAGARGIADAAAVAHAVADTCAEVARERGVEIDVREPTAGLRVGVDEDLAERILHPVVENACRYGRSRVVLAVAREGAGVAFAVDDDGPGVTAEEREAIFEPAVRGSAGRRSGVGAGLGLALARRLARAAEGEIELREAGGGRFVVLLPAA